MEKPQSRRSYQNTVTSSKYKYPHPVTGRLVSRQRIWQLKHESKKRPATKPTGEYDALRLRLLEKLTKDKEGNQPEEIT